jgi:hypothetical protein
LLDHNVEKAYGLVLGKGRFNSSIRLSFEGTVGHFTVDATELLKAVHTIAGTPDSVNRSVPRSQSKTVQASESKRTVTSTRELAFPKPIRTPGQLSTGAAKVPSKVVNKGTKRASKNPDQWSTYDNHILRICSPKKAARKLGRPLDQILARMDELGV